MKDFWFPGLAALGAIVIFLIGRKLDSVRDWKRGHVDMPRALTDKQADAALAATAAFLDIKGSALTVNREKMKARYRALVKFIENEGKAK